MVGFNGNIWRQEQLDLMSRMVDGYLARGKRPPWDDISLRVGHPRQSCQTMMSKIRRERHNEHNRELLRQLRQQRPAPQPWLPDKKHQAPPNPRIVITDHMRSTSTAKLMLDAELRMRIGAQGITAGLLGDPLPGRSALDLKLQRTAR